MTVKPDRSYRREDERDLTLSLDAFVRSIGVKKSIPHPFLLGAGASVTSGIPSAEKCIWEWKRSIFLTNNPGLEAQFSELSLASVRRKIQSWLDKQGAYPQEGSPDEYGFYIETCFPIAADRRAYFQDKVRNARPHIGYRLLCRLAESDLTRAVWTTNFDGLAARAAANFNLSPLEIGMDTQGRIRPPNKGDLLCVSLHGDYRYDRLKNTPQELQTQESVLRKTLIEDLRNTSLVVCGYSGRDESVMEGLFEAYRASGNGALYWCGFSDGDIPDNVARLIECARQSGRQAHYVYTQGFDDLLIRLAFHCLDGKAREEARHEIAAYTNQPIIRTPFRLPEYPASTLIKSNAFEIECPAEVLQCELKKWPEEKVWSWLRDTAEGHEIVAVPFKNKVLALGTIDEIKDAFGDNIKGAIERTPVSPDELRYQDGVIVSLMRQALVRSMAETAGVQTDGRRELWRSATIKKIQQDGIECHAHDAVLIFLRRIGDSQYVVLKPSVKVLDRDGNEVPREIADPVKLGILGYQHNKPFNQAVGAWRKQLFANEKTVTFEFPFNGGSPFRFLVRRSPIFGQIGLPSGGRSASISAATRRLLKHRGLQLEEPPLLFSNKAGAGTVKDTHPMRGIVDNRPFDFPLTLRGLSTNLRLGVVCPQTETKNLHNFLTRVQKSFPPGSSERDYLIDYPGFQTGYGLPIEIPDPDQPGWVTCAEPDGNDPIRGALNAATNINNAIQALQSSYAPHVVLIYFPDRWSSFRGYRNDQERFDVHDFVKAFAVQRGVATQFLNQDTLCNPYQCRVWWWLSLALYVKSMRTPWVLDGLDDDTAFVGLGFTIEPGAEKGRHVVLGCSHIYSARGEGLQYRLSKVENPIFKQGNPFMSGDDARRVGETIRQLFFDARSKLPRRVVLHKRTPFLRQEREGLFDGLTGVENIDLLEVQVDNALRYVASVTRPNGTPDEDNYPVRRGTVMALDDFTALLWVHGTTSAVNPRLKYYQGKRRIPAPLTLRRHAGSMALKDLAQEILGLSKMNWNTFDLYTKHPATLESSNEIARIGSLLQRFGAESYDYRLFI